MFVGGGGWCLFWYHQKYPYVPMKNESAMLYSDRMDLSHNARPQVPQQGMVCRGLGQYFVGLLSFFSFFL